MWISGIVSNRIYSVTEYLRKIMKIDEYVPLVTTVPMHRTEKIIPIPPRISQ